MSGSYASGTSTVPLLGETIGDNLRRTVARFGDREALVDRGSGRRFTYTELFDAVEALAAGLVAAGVGKGDRVGIWAPNRWEWVILQYATADMGAILVNINPAYRTHELEYVLNQAGISAAGGGAGVQDQRLPGDGRRGAGPVPAAAVGVSSSATRSGSRCRPGDRSVLPEIRAGLSFDDPINIQYTSGTTGFPKGATLSHHNILNNGFFVGELCSYTEADRVCIPVPFYHCFGMVMGNLGATSHGSCMVIPAEGFDPRATLEAVAAERCTSLYGVPTMFIAELGDPSFGSHDLSSLRTGIMAGSPCPVEVMKRVVADMGMAEVTICYGMTETSPVSTQTRVTDDLERRVSTVGQVHPHVEIKIVDPATGLVVPSGTPGELCTRGVLGDARLLGRAGEDRRGARRRRLDAHRRPGRDGRGRATSTSSGGSRTWSSAAARTSTRARSRSSSTPTRTSSTRRSRACRTRSTARSWSPGCG